jgi:hypothetical protein
MLIGTASMGAAMSFALVSRQSENQRASGFLSAADRVARSYGDDTYQSLLTAPRVEKLWKDYGLNRYQFVWPSRGGRVVLDARGATFVVANSKNPNPTAQNDCARGSEPVNPYPLTVSDSNDVTIIGGLITSRVPQTSDWLYTYCNSASLHIRHSPGTVVDGIRIAGGWDGVRASEGSPNLQLENSWLSEIRDDAVEDDYLYSVSIRDSLIDGAFQGVSVKQSGSHALNGLQETVVLSGLLLRLREYPYRGQNRLGAITKNELVSPSIQMRNSVIAVDYNGGAVWRDYWARGWTKMLNSKNNIFLWLSDEPIPASLPTPPQSAGFETLSGLAARRVWERAKQNWIDCHPRIGRMPDDPHSQIRRCDRNYWGGRGD